MRLASVAIRGPRRHGCCRRKLIAVAIIATLCVDQDTSSRVPAHRSTDVFCTVFVCKIGMALIDACLSSYQRCSCAACGQHARTSRIMMCLHGSPLRRSINLRRWRTHAAQGTARNAAQAPMEDPLWSERLRPRRSGSFLFPSVYNLDGDSADRDISGAGSKAWRKVEAAQPAATAPASQVPRRPAWPIAAFRPSLVTCAHRAAPGTSWFPYQNRLLT